MRTRRPIRIGISACLLGERVRYDGGHKRDAWLTDVLARRVVFVPVCPEVESGMGVPRPTLRLVGDRGAPRLVVQRSGSDETRRMMAYAAARLESLEREGLSGFVLKSGSPSCGLAGVPVHPRRTGAIRRGTGLFARALRARFPRLPIQQENRLRDSRSRARFFARVLAYARSMDSAAEASRDDPHRLARSGGVISGRAPRSGRARFANRRASSGA